MVRHAFVILLALVLAASASGCYGSAKTTDYRVFASKGSVVSGWAYDGKGVADFQGDAALHVNDEKNSGLLVAKGKFGGVDFGIRFDRFAEQSGKPFQDGGIAADFHEHGHSGTGDQSIPEVDLAMAGWGKAAVTLAGKPFLDPVTSSPDWVAHFMVIRNGVRNDTTRGIYQDSTNSKVYNRTIGEGYGAPGDWELHLVLKNGTKPGPLGATILASDSVQAPTAAYTKDLPLFSSSAVGSRVLFTINVSGAADLHFEVVDPMGQSMMPRDLNTVTKESPLSATTQVSFETEKLGDYHLKVTGSMGATAGFDAKGIIVPPPSVVMNLWWEELVFGEEAEKKIEDAKLT